MSIHDNTVNPWADIPATWDIELPEWEIEPPNWDVELPTWDI